MNNSKIKTLLGAGLLATLMHSFCCIVPLVALLGSVSGLATTLTWIEPLEPYMFSFSVLSLAIAFYFAYRPSKQKHECTCDVHEHKSIIHSKGFLWGVTVFTLIMYFVHYFTDFMGHSH